jgi:succinoglycan biosynthesis protein ExoA
VSADPSSGAALPRVSVVLPARNEAKSIEAAIRALTAQTYPPDLLEILVVDGRSTDGTGDIVRELGRGDRRIRLIDNPAYVTPAALNAGIAAAGGEVIVRMDGHARAEPDYVERAVETLRKTGAWSVGGQMHKTGETPAQRANAVAASSPVGVGDAAHNYATEARWAETVFLGTWPRWVFDRVGLFDEELVRNQDDEHAYRIRAAGGRIRYEPSLVVHYAARPGLTALFEQYRQYGYWKVRVFQKHPKAARWRHFIPAAFVGALTIGALAAPWSRLGGTILGTTAASYLMVIGSAIGRMQTPGTSRPRVMAAIATMHAGYGIGFWQGIVAFGPRWLRKSGTGEPA